MLFWESTTRCNLSCVHCRRLETDPADDELTTAEAKAVFDSAADLGKPVIVFSGGEPLMRNDWEELAAHARQLELPTALATNGTLIDGNMAKRIAAVGFRRVAISIDGADPATHDEFRGQPGAYAAALAGLAALRAEAVPVQLNVTVTTGNVDQLDAIYALARDRQAVAVHLFLLVPVGCGVQIGESRQISARRYEEVLNWVCDRQAEGDLELRATCAPHYYRVAAMRGMDVGKSRGCLAGISVIFVSHRGKVFPCGYLPVDCGDTRDQPLADIWRNSPQLLDLRDYDKLKGKCRRCDFRQICGGCRARAYGATGDCLAEEPFCDYQPQ